MFPKEFMLVCKNHYTSRQAAVALKEDYDLDAYVLLNGIKVEDLNVAATSEESRLQSLRVRIQNDEDFTKMMKAYHKDFILNFFAQ